MLHARAKPSKKYRPHERVCLVVNCQHRRKHAAGVVFKSLSRASLIYLRWRRKINYYYNYASFQRAFDRFTCNPSDQLYPYRSPVCACNMQILTQRNISRLRGVIGRASQKPPSHKRQHI